MVEARSSLNSGRVIGWVVLPVMALILMYAPVSESTINGWYALEIYPFLQTMITGATNFVPFAILDVLIIAVSLMTLFGVLRVLRIASSQGFIEALWDGTRGLVGAVGRFVCLFLVEWAYNYRRQPLEQTFPAGHVTTPTVESLQAAVIDANSLAAKLRRTIGSAMDQGYDQVAGALEVPLDTALKQLQQAPL